MQTKPSIVFAHGIWADGSSFRKLIPTLQEEGHITSPSRSIVVEQGARIGD